MMKLSTFFFMCVTVFVMATESLLGSNPPAAPVDTTAVVRAKAPGTVFIITEPLEFTLARPMKVSWKVYDWRGKEVATGKWPGEGRNKLRLKTLPVGYYTLELVSDTIRFRGRSSFTVVSDPATRQHNPDSFFAVDSAQSWLGRPNALNVRFPGAGYEVISELIRRAGVENVRERMRWSEVEPKKGEFNGCQYMTNARLLSERGIGILGMYHDAPQWTKTNSKKLPDDLIAVYRFARKAAIEFSGKMKAWEFWNEPDIGFADEPAWDYAATLKAAALGFKAENPSIPVLIAGMAVTPLLPYNDVVMQNDAGAYFDIFNVHTYRPLRDYPEIVRGIREFMVRHGIADKPLWFTENGTLAEGSGRVSTYIPGIKAHSPEQELLVAEFLPKCMIYMQSLGVERDYFFVFPATSEQNGNKHWGIMRRDYSVEPAYAALSTLTKYLGSAEYLGEMNLGDAVRAFLYRQPDGTQTLVCWSLSELDREPNRPDLTPSRSFATQVTLPVTGRKYRSIDLVGRGSEIVSHGGKLTLKCDRYPVYVTGLSGLVPDKPFYRNTQSAPLADDYDRTVISKLVLSKDFSVAAGKDYADLKHPSGKFVLQLFNLSESEKCGSVTVAGGEVSGLPEKITLPPFGKMEFPLELTLPEGVTQTELTVSGAFDGKPITKLVMPVVVWNRLTAKMRQVELVNAGDPLNWKENASGKMKITFDSAERAVTFDTEFRPGVDRWVYPEYILQLPQESLRGAYGISFESRTNHPAAITQMIVMTVWGHGNKQDDLYLRTNKPEKEWQRSVVTFDQISDPGKIRMLRIGVNARADKVTYQIRNLKVLYRDRN